MKNSCLFVFILLITFSASAQLNLMKEGRDALLVTHRGDSLWGKAEVNLGKQLVQMKAHRGFRVVDFRRIELLRLYDEAENSVIAYRTYPRDRYRTELLEQVVVGSIHYLKKSRPRTYANYLGGEMMGSTTEVVESNYFIWYEGRLNKVKNFKKQFLSILSSEEQLLITDFQKENQLKFYRNYDQAVFINYINNLRQSQELAAVDQSSHPVASTLQKKKVERH
ncbi:MAG: hypothetical protein AAF551_06805 [Bacteroidota bacterium]